MVLARAEADPVYGPEGSAESRGSLAAVYFALCTIAFDLGQSHETLQLALRSAAIAHEADDLATAAAALGMVATAAAFVGDFEMAGQYAAESRRLAEKEGNRFALAMVLVSPLYLTVMSQGEDHDRIWDDWRRGIGMLREGEDYSALAIGYQLAAIVVRVQGDVEKAQFYADASLASYEMLSDANAHFASVPRTILAELAMDRGEFDQAEREFKQLLPSWPEATTCLSPPKF
jgi:tetratricopeptide (TPR) repeat protein